MATTQDSHGTLPDLRPGTSATESPVPDPPRHGSSLQTETLPRPADGKELVAGRDGFLIAPAARVRDMVSYIETEVVKTVAGLFLPDTDPGHNPAGDLPESDVPFKTKFAARRYHEQRSNEATAKLAIALKVLELPAKDDVAPDVIDVTPNKV